MSFLENLPFYDFLLEFVNDTLNIDGYLQQGFDFLMGLDVVTQLVVLLVGTIIFIMGAFELIKKLSKLIIIVAILAGLYVLYDSGALDSLIGG